MVVAIKTDEKSFSSLHQDFKKVLQDYRSSPENSKKFEEAEKLIPFRDKKVKPEKFYRGKGNQLFCCLCGPTRNSLLLLLSISFPIAIIALETFLAENLIFKGRKETDVWWIAGSAIFFQSLMILTLLFTAFTNPGVKKSQFSKE